MGMETLAMTGLSMLAKGMATKSAADTQAGAVSRATQTLMDSYNQAFDTELKYLDEQRTSLKEGLTKSEAALAKSKEDAIGYYEPYVDAGKDALQMYKDAVTPGNEYGFEESPIYKYRKAELEKEIGAKAAASGKGRSGTALEQYYTPGYLQLSAEESSNQLSRLSPLLQYGYSGAGASANLESGYGKDIANLESTYGQNMANVASGTSGRQQNIQMGKGAAEAGGIQDIGAIRSGEQLSYGNIAQTGISDINKFKGYEDYMKKGGA